MGVGSAGAALAARRRPKRDASVHEVSVPQPTLRLWGGTPVAGVPAGGRGMLVGRAGVSRCRRAPTPGFSLCPVTARRAHGSRAENRTSCFSSEVGTRFCSLNALLPSVLSVTSASPVASCGQHGLEAGAGDAGTLNAPAAGEGGFRHAVLGAGT